jgi:chemotaxis protein MotB
MAGHGGGAWKVAYADFVTAMMAFFMVMWITGQSKQVKEAVAGYFKDPGKATGFHGSKSPSPVGLPGQVRPVAATEKSKVEGKHKRSAGVGRGSEQNNKRGFFAVHGGERTMVGTAIVFPEMEAELDQNGKEQLERIVSELRGKPNKIELRGHASRKPLPPESPYQDVWQLTYARCTSALKFLEEKGIPADRIRLCQAGAYEPYTIRVDPDAQRFNSRVEVYVLNEFAEDLVGTSEERNERFRGPGKGTPGKSEPKAEERRTEEQKAEEQRAEEQRAEEQRAEEQKTE